jgi:hypothetical protein
VHDWPNLLDLQERDPALTSRLVMVPARGRFNQPPGEESDSIQDELDSLAPAFGRLLVDAFRAYKTAGNRLMPLSAAVTPQGSNSSSSSSSVSTEPSAQLLCCWVLQLPPFI